MKKIITLGLFILSLPTFCAINLTCYQSGISEDGYQHDQMTGVKSTSIISCHNKRDEFYTVLISGIGLGINHDLFSDFVLSCPTVNKKKLDRKGEVSLGSIKASASFIVGADVTVAINHKGGLCVMAGYDIIGYSAAISFGKLTILKGDIISNEEKLNKYHPLY